MKLKQVMAVGLSAAMILSTGIGEVTAFAEDNQELTQEISENVNDGKSMDNDNNETEKTVEENDAQKTQNTEAATNEEEKNLENQNSIKTEETQENAIEKKKLEENASNENMAKASSSEVVDSENFNGVDWKLYADGRLVIEGSGRVPSYAYRWRDKITNVTIGENITSIGDSAFSKAPNLTDVTIKGENVDIGLGVFYECKNLKNVNITGSISNIGIVAFRGCESLRNLVFPGTISSVGSSAFIGCSELTSVSFPDGVASIGESSFYGLQKLTNVTIKKGITVIENTAFSSCSNLPTIDSAEGVVPIGKSAFFRTGIKSIKISDKTESIGESAFYFCDKLENITIPSSVKTISSEAFAECSVLKKVSMEEGITQIGSRAFEWNQGLIDLELPRSLKTVASDAFVGCKGIKNIYYNGTESEWKKLGIVALFPEDVKVQFKQSDIDGNKTGVYQADDGNWYYYKNGKKDTTFNGLAKNSYGVWYCKNGKVQFDTTGVIESKSTYNGWYYVKKGQLQTGQVTVKSNSNGWWYINKDGKVDFSFNGLAKNENGVWYCKKGQVQFGTTDVIESKGTYNGWYYVKKGQLQTGKEIVEQNSTGWWYINKDGKVDFNFNGLAKNGNGIWYCKKGKVQFNATDVLYSKGTYEGWYYVKKGQLQTGKVTVEQNSTGWWYIAKDGKVDFSFTGIASNAYGSWYLEKGKVNFNKNISAYTDPHTKLLYKVVKGKATRIKEHVYTESKRDLQYIYYKCKDCGATKKEFNDQTYTIDLGNGKTTTVVGHFNLEMRQEILDLVNEKRAIFHRGALSLPSIDSFLQNAANIRAYEITYSYSHTRPNGERGITSFNVDGENLAEGFTSAYDVCQAWFASESHLRNITNASYNTMGVGVFCAKTDYGYENYFSQMFSCDSFHVTN